MEDSQPELLNYSSPFRWSLGSALPHDGEDAVAIHIAETEPHMGVRMCLKSLIAMLFPVPQLDELPNQWVPGQPQHHQRSQQGLGLPPRATHAVPCTCIV